MAMVRVRRLLLFAAAQALVLWLLCLLAWNPRVQTARTALGDWLNGRHLYPCAFLKRPAVFAHGDSHYYVVWETTCASGTPVLEWWAEAAGSGPAPVRHYTKPSYRTIDGAHHRYTAIIGPVAGAARVSYKASSYRLSTAQHTFSRRGESERTRVLVIADNQNGPTVFRRVLDAIQRHYGSGSGPDAVLHVGDAVQSVDSLGDWQKQMFSPMEDGGGYLQRAPLVFVPGNHDHDKRRTPNNANVYADMYHGLYRTDDLDSVAVKNGSYHRFHHSLSLGGARLIVLDAECPSEEQSAFLERELRSDAFQAARFRIVAVHIPPFMEFWDPYAWNKKGEKHWGEHVRLEYNRLFREHRVDLVISGHQHNYQRSTVRRGEDPARASTITYAIVGGAGGALDRKRVEDWHMYNTTFLDHHFVAMDIDDRRLSWTAHNIAGTVVDSFVIERQVHGPPGAGRER
ncbi:hypothetical protein LPJ61_000504 [Coemansia biformis]|uniref:Calcineurin-like phosphoesterase domain-containing protein n=1 Tax=Coemansia biformis TaxID=1286918 RepID=A0A9W7YGL3_9FUNG|nr:hypothetical protein LPJ61_000504 [Coemansia biformis]